MSESGTVPAGTAGNILISSAGKRVSLLREFQRELKKVFPRAKVFAGELNPQMSPAAQISDGVFRVPHVTEPTFADELFRICIGNDVRVVIPTIDTELPILAAQKRRFAAAGIALLVPDSEFVAACRDKRKTGELFRKLGIRVPAPIDRTAPTFPLFAKPFDGSLSRDTFIVRSRDELTPEILGNPKLMFMELIDRKIYKEFTADMYFGRDCRLKSVIPRERLEIRAGEINKGIARKNFLYEILREHFAALPGVVGCICAQFFVNEATRDVVGIEINPRFGGGYPLSYGAGANFPRNVIREYFFGERLGFSENWRNGTLMLRYDDEIFVPERPTVVVFDLDDTLFKERDFLCSAFREIAGTLAANASGNTDEIFAEMLLWRARGENVFEKLTARFGVPVAELLKRYRAHVPATLPPAPHARETLAALRSRGAIPALMTDGRSRTQRAKLHALGFEEFFADADILVSEEFGSEKLSPRNCEFFAKKFPDAAFCCVGDNPKKDFLVPNALGWKTVCLLDEKAENIHPQNFDAVPAEALPQYKIRSLSELPKILTLE